MKRLSKNFLSIILSDMARRLFGFFAVAYLARKVGTAGFGIINIGFTVLSYALLASSAGLSTFGTREAAQGAGSESVSKIISLRLMFAFLVFVVVYVAVKFVVQDVVTAKLITIFCLSIFANAALLDWYFQGKERMTIVGVGRGISAVTYLLFLIIFVHSERDIVWVALGAVIGDTIATVLLLNVYRHHYGDLRLTFEPRSWKSLAAKSLLLSGGNILANMSINLPPLVIGIMMTNVHVGIYSAASKLIFFLLMLDRVFATLLLPAASRLYADSPEKLSDRLGVALKWIVVAALPLSIGGTLLSDKIILLVFGAQYIDAAILFRILIWYFFFTMLHTVFTSGLVAIGQEKLYTKTMSISAVLYFSSVILCTKMFGAVGAAAAMVGSEAITLILMQRQFRKFVKVDMGVYILKALPAAVIMGCVLFFVSSVHLIATIMIGGIVYGSAVYLTRAITRTDVKELLERV